MDLWRDCGESFVARERSSCGSSLVVRFMARVASLLIVGRPKRRRVIVMLEWDLPTELYAFNDLRAKTLDDIRDCGMGYVNGSRHAWTRHA